MENTSENDLVIKPIAVLFALLVSSPDSAQHRRLLRNFAISPIIEKPPKKHDKRNSPLSGFENESVTVEVLEQQEMSGAQKGTAYRVRAKLQPLVLATKIKDTIKTNNAKVAIELNDVRIIGVNVFELQGMAADGHFGGNKRAQMNFEMPRTVQLTAEYRLDGIAFGKRVRGHGLLTVNLNGMKMLGWVTIRQVSLVDQSHVSRIQLQNLELEYQFDDMDIHFSGLKFGDDGKDRMPEKELRGRIKEVAERCLRERSNNIAVGIADQLRYTLNRKLLTFPTNKLFSPIPSVD